ncbi:MAG: hypothetical protein GWO02_04420, partial [Gammaproteobacteria bacterium]|nr:hypothetical protein [Gammaproteobacteria bacterium]
MCGLLLALPALAAERPRIYAITGATIVTAPGEKLEGATIVLRDGLIESVGAEVSPPEDAVTIDGEGRWVYAGLIDVDSSLGVSTGGRGGNAAPGGGGGGFPGSRSRAPRPGAGHELSLVHPEQRVRDKLVPFEGDGAREMERIRELGFTAVLVTPTDGILRGRSSAILLAGDRTVPQLILRDDVAQHAGFQRAGFGGGYPTSLMGGAAALRQTFLDAERAASWAERYDDSPQGMPRPPHNAAFEALEPVLEGDQPLFFRTDDAQNSLLADRIA